MTHTTSLEVSKELYEKSGWERDRFDGGEPSFAYWRHESAVIVHDYYQDDSNCTFVAPAYAAGYLMRKLPEGPLLWNHRGNDWVVRHGNHKAPIDISAYVSADTPEDALALLAIALIDANVISKEKVS